MRLYELLLIEFINRFIGGTVIHKDDLQGVDSGGIFQEAAPVAIDIADHLGYSGFFVIYRDDQR